MNFRDSYLDSTYSPVIPTRNAGMTKKNGLLVFHMVMQDLDSLI
ncbi:MULTISPECIES: hypothetical protein [unclassified Wolbachia]|nr:hypothetical protein [Wolbachia endosymbiont of Psylliodes chrysocephala]